MNMRFRLVAGAEYTGSTGYAAIGRNLKAALRKLEDVRRRIDAGEESTLRRTPKPFSDAVAVFNDWAKGEYREHPATARRLSMSMTSMVAFFDRMPVHTLTAGAVEDYKAWRRSCGIRDITLRHDLHALSKLLQYAIKQNWAWRNVVREVAIPSDRGAVRQHVLSLAEERAYFAAAARWPDLHDVARLILLQGLRPEEAMRLRSADVDIEAGLLTVVRGNTAAAKRTLRLVDEAAAILAARVEGEYVFPGRQGQKQLTTLQKQHDKALKASGTNFVLYDLRHTFATRMAEAGCPLATLAAILGHANLRTIERYVHVGREAQWEAMERFGARLSAFRPLPDTADSDLEGRRGSGAASRKLV